jgi:hypothetical protein
LRQAYQIYLGCLERLVYLLRLERQKNLVFLEYREYQVYR